MIDGITCNYLLKFTKNTFGFFYHEIYIPIRIEVDMDDILPVQNNVKNDNNLNFKSTP